MTGREIVEICKKHEDCDECEVCSRDICERLMQEMSEVPPSEYYNVLEDEYGGDS